MAREPKTKLCRCGRGKIFTDHRSAFNGKDSKGRQVCSTCVVEQITAPFVNRD